MKPHIELNEMPSSCKACPLSVSISEYIFACKASGEVKHSFTSECSRENQRHPDCPILTESDYYTQEEYMELATRFDEMRKELEKATHEKFKDKDVRYVIERIEQGYVKRCNELAGERVKLYKKIAKLENKVRNIKIQNEKLAGRLRDQREQLAQLNKRKVKTPQITYYFSTPEPIDAEKMLTFVEEQKARELKEKQKEEEYKSKLEGYMQMLNSEENERRQTTEEISKYQDGYRAFKRIIEGAEDEE